MSLAAVALDDRSNPATDHTDASLHVARVELAAMNVLSPEDVPRLGPVWHALLACWSPPTTRELALVVGLPLPSVGPAVSDLQSLGVVATHHGCHHAVDPRSGRLAHPQARQQPSLPRDPSTYLLGRPVLARPGDDPNRLTRLLIEQGLPPLPATVTGPAREVLAELLEALRPLSSVELAQRLNKHRGNIDRALQQLRAVGAVATRHHKHSPAPYTPEAPSP